MYQSNPLLFESKKHLMKQLSRYTPEEISRIRQKMLSLGKKNGGWYSADEYGRRMYNGQIKRASKLFKKYNFTPNLFTDDRPNAAGVSFGKSFDGRLADDISYVIPGLHDKLHPMTKVKGVLKSDPDIRKFAKDNGYKKSTIRKIERYNRNIQNANKPLTNAHTATHETDELESLLRNHSIAKNSRSKLNSFWNGMDSHITNKKNPLIQTHNPNVLDREARRNHLLKSMYGKEIAIRPRTHKEFSYNTGEYLK